MSLEDALKLVGAVALSFGSGAAIVIALSGWLTDNLGEANAAA